jgi:hypothetical protein
MNESYSARMKALAVKTRSRFAIDGVARYRMTDIRHMDAYLVRPARLEPEADVSISPVTCHYFIMRNGVPRRLLRHRHLFALSGMPADRRVDSAGILF